MLRRIWATIALLIMATLIFNPIGTTLADGPLLGGPDFRRLEEKIDEGRLLLPGSFAGRWS